MASTKNVQANIKEALEKTSKKDPKNPKMDLTHMQWQLKSNSEDVQTYISDLNDWCNDVKKKDKDANIRDKKKVGVVDCSGKFLNKFGIFVVDKLLSNICVLFVLGLWKGIGENATHQEQGGA